MSLLFGSVISPLAGAGDGYCSAQCRSAAEHGRRTASALAAIEQRCKAEAKLQAEEDEKNRLFNNLRRIWNSDSAYQDGFQPFDQWDIVCPRCQQVTYGPGELGPCHQCHTDALSVGNYILGGTFTTMVSCRRCASETLVDLNCPECNCSMSEAMIRTYAGGGHSLMPIFEGSDLWITGPRVLDMETKTGWLSGVTQISSVEAFRQKYDIPSGYLIHGVAKLSTQIIAAGSMLFFPQLRDRRGKKIKAESVQKLLPLSKCHPKLGWLNTTINVGDVSFVLPNSEAKQLLHFADLVAAKISLPFEVRPIRAAEAHNPPSSPPQSKPPPLPKRDTNVGQGSANCPPPPSSQPVSSALKTRSHPQTDYFVPPPPQP